MEIRNGFRYVSNLDITRKFRFEWRFLTLDIPGKSTVLPPEIYEREKEKFQSMMDETRELAISALREDFAKNINGLTEKLNKDCTQPPPRVIKSSMFNKMREFLDGFGTRNIFEDQVLELSQQAKALKMFLRPVSRKMMSCGKGSKTK